VAIITGAARGLGYSYAGALSDAGAAVMINDVDDDATMRAVDGIRSNGGLAEGWAGSISDSSNADAMVADTVSRLGRLDIMVTNAGILRDRVLWKMSDEDFDDVVSVHLRGTFNCARSAAVHFREAGHAGRLILVGSPAGQRGNFGQSNYAACKAGITAMARTWAMELARSEVTVNCIIPTAATEMTKTIPAFSAHIEAWENGDGPLPDWLRQDFALGSAGEAAPLVVYLSSDASASVTGQTIGLGGDRLALWSYPDEVATSLRAGGWDADSIAEEFESRLSAMVQSYGITFPEAPPAGVGSVG
jgi:NAD(P)-dependent dehydrogenase (short-subunit alcohol dehydrogenase family)